MNVAHNPWNVLVVTSFGVFLVMMNMSTLTVALPSITSYYGASTIEASWILLAYMLCNTVFILIFGKVADLFGRKQLFVIGLITFTCFSFLCGFAPSVEWLIVYRALQGISGALVITNTTPLITDAFRSGPMSKALGINVVVSSVAQLVGPVIGGYVTFMFDWQWVFWCNVPLGALAIVSAVILLPKRIPAKKDISFDYMSSVAIFIGLGSLIIGVTMSGEYGWGSTIVQRCVSIGLVFFILFLFTAKHAKQPLIELTIFKNSTFSFANMTTFLNALARSSVVLLMALYFQVIYGANPLEAGVWVLPLTAGTVIASFFIGQLAARWKTRVLTTSGLMISALGIVCIFMNLHVNGIFFALMLGQFLIGFGSGIFMTPNTQLIMLSVPAHTTGVANGIRSMLQNMGGVLSTACALVIVTVSLPKELKASIYEVGERSLNMQELTMIAHGFQLAFSVIFVITLLAIISAYLTTAQRIQFEKQLIED